MFTDNSLLDIGRKFGGRDHSTVLHSVATIEDLLAKNPSGKSNSHITEQNEKALWWKKLVD